MANGKKDNNEVSMPMIGMLVMGIAGAIVSAACFIVIRYWPLPISVAPYFGGRIGLAWGAIVGALLGLVIGFLVDEKHFSES